MDILATQSSSNTFECDITLPLEYNYKFKIFEKSTAGGIKELNTEELNIYVYNDFNQNRVQIDGSYGTADESGIILNYSLRNNTNGFEGNEINYVVLSLYYGDLLIYQEDITEYTDPVILGDIGGPQNESSTFGFTTSESSTTVEEKINHTEIDTAAGNDINYYIYLDKDQLVEQFPELKDVIGDLVGNLSYHFSVTLKNGTKIEL